MSEGVSFFGEPRRRRLICAAGVYLGFTLVAAFVASPTLFQRHTPYDHFALLAEAWLHGRLDLGGPPPAYTGNDDFALFEGRYYVVFPPFPALLLVPWVALAGSAEAVPDGSFFLGLSGFAPALLFLVLEKLRARGESPRSERDNLLIALSFGFGSVYFFSAVQGSVWFAAHVVGALLLCLYVGFALGAEHPLAAGSALALAFATRTPLLFAAPLFVVESIRHAVPSDAACPLDHPFVYARSIDRKRVARELALFALPVALVLASSLAYNQARFGDPFEVGYRYLDVVWRARIEKWGLFNYHFLAKNLGVMLTSLPWVPGERGAAFTINEHGLALWITTPLYLLLLWPKQKPKVAVGFWLAAICVALPSLFYQNTGWLEFGYRFSNDYAPLLFALFAVGAWRIRSWVWLLLAWGVIVNAFGALTFGRPAYGRYYFAEGTQRVLYQPD